MDDDFSPYYYGAVRRMLGEPPPLPRLEPIWNRLPAPRPPTVRVCGVEVAILPLAPPGWFGTMKLDDGKPMVVAQSVEAAAAVLGRIVWTSPPCWMKSDGTLMEIPRDGRSR